MTDVFPISSGLTTTGLTTVNFGAAPGTDGATAVIIRGTVVVDGYFE